MININIDNLLFSKSFLNLKYSSKIKEVMKNIKSKHKNNKLRFLDIDKNNDLLKIEKYVNDNYKKYENIVVLWIGWWTLWTKGIFQAIKWKYYNELSSEKRNFFPKLHILDSIDPLDISSILNIINFKKTLFIVVSKNWSNLETISHFVFFKKCISDNNLDLKNHFVVIAWENSKFKEKNVKEWFKVFDIPEWIPLRYSSLTNASLLPLAFVWIDIRKLLTWVANVKNTFLSWDISLNTSLLTSVVQYHSLKELWKNITVFFPFISNLSWLWNWYNHLISESLWKDWIWVSVINSAWVSGQYSSLQLYTDWPNDKLIMFLGADVFDEDINISSYHDLSFSELLKYEKEWTEKSISEFNKINYSIQISKIDEENIWELILLFQMQSSILWELYWVNYFDNPLFDRWKKISKKITEKNTWKLDFLDVNLSKNLVFIWWWNGQSGLLEIFKSYIKKHSDILSDNYDITSIVSMSDDWRTTWMLMKSFKEELDLHLPPPWDIRRILFTLSKSKYKDFFSIIFNKTFELDSPIKTFNLWELFLKVSTEVLSYWNLVDLRIYIEDYLNKSWEIYEIINWNNLNLNYFVLPLNSSIKWHKFWNILMASLYYNLWQNYDKMLSVMKTLLEVEDSVLPVTTQSCYIKAILQDGSVIKTQDKISNVADYKSTIKKIELLDLDIVPEITEKVKKAIKYSDYIILGPWDLYTSIISNFIVKWLREEIEKSDAKIIFILNANNKTWETTWYSVNDFIEVISDNLWTKNINYLFANNKIPNLDSNQKNRFKNDISVKWWEYLIVDGSNILNLTEKFPDIRIINSEYIYSKDLYRYNENLIKDLINIIR